MQCDGGGACASSGGVGVGGGHAVSACGVCVCVV